MYIQKHYRSSHRRCSIKTCVLKACNFTKKETLAKAFLCDFEKLLRAPTSQNTSRWLLLTLLQSTRIKYISTRTQLNMHESNNILLSIRKNVHANFLIFKRCVLILRKFNPINQLLFRLKRSENHRFSDHFSGNRS